MRAQPPVRLSCPRTIRCEASTKPAKLKLSVVEAAEVAEAVKAAKKATAKPCRQTRVQMGAEVAAEAAAEAAAAEAAAARAVAARAVARIRRAAPCRQSGMGSFPEMRLSMCHLPR